MFRRFICNNLTGIVTGLGAINAGLVALAISHEDRLFKSERDAWRMEMAVNELQSSRYQFSPIGQVQYVVSKTDDGSHFVQDGEGNLLPPPTAQDSLN